MNFAMFALCLMIMLLIVSISMCTHDLIKALDEINKTLKTFKK